jgi:hypothetical protein
MEGFFIMLIFEKKTFSARMSVPTPERKESREQNLD